MRARAANITTKETRLIDTDELRGYTSLGRNSAMKLGEDAGAKIKIGKRTLWDKEKISRYISALTEV